MKHGLLSIVILLYFIGSVVYMLSYKAIGFVDFKPWLGVFYYLLQYSLFFIFAIGIGKHVYYSLDLLSLSFFKAYVVFKFVFFSLLINSDMPTYMHWMDNKIISLILSILVLVFTLALNCLKNERWV